MDPYSVLGVAADATMAEVRAAYRLRPQLLHPDRHRDSPEQVRKAAEKAMADLNAAYDSLKDLPPSHEPPPADAKSSPENARRLRCPRCGAITVVDLSRAASSCGGCGASLRSARKQKRENEYLWIRLPNSDDSSDDCADWFVDRLSVALCDAAVIRAIRLRDGDLDLLAADTAELSPEARRKVMKLLSRASDVVRAALSRDTLEARASGVVDAVSGVPLSWVRNHERALDARRYPVAAQIAAVIANLDLE